MSKVKLLQTNTIYLSLIFTLLPAKKTIYYFCLRLDWLNFFYYIGQATFILLVLGTSL